MINIIIVVCYFMVVVGIGWLFRNFSKSTSDYYRGSGKMLWWLIGGTSLMVQFSAATFTGHMGKAFNDGGAILAIFFGNAFGFFLNYLYFAARTRQTRAVTSVDALRMRFGSTSEQFFTWARIPTTFLSSAIQLNALAIFVSALLGLDMKLTIILTGSVITLMSFSGGSWAVVASDYVQMITIMVVTLAATLVSVVKGGGIGPILANGLPEASPIAGNGIQYFNLFAFWVILSIMRQGMNTNTMIGASRYLAAKDSKNAKKAALLACLLMLIASLLWFIPAWYMAWQHPDPSTWGLDHVTGKITDTVYLSFMLKEMPHGMTGLLIAAMCSATMSSMDSALNNNSGIFVKNFYKVKVNKNATDDQLLKVGKISTLIFGIMVITLSVYASTLRVGIFGMVMLIGSFIGLPIGIPNFLGFLYKKTPDWSGWATVVFGGFVSFFVTRYVTPDFIQNLFNLELPFTGREVGDLRITVGVIAHFTLTTGFFMFTSLFYDKTQSEERKKELDEFEALYKTPVVANYEDEDEMDYKQRSILGKVLLGFGAAISLLMLIPNPLWGRVLFLGISGSIMLSGYMLIKSAGNLKGIEVEII